MCSLHDITFEQRALMKDYAGQKNYLTRMCKGSYIINIDADEIPNKVLIDNLPAILETNPNNEVYLIPRVNTVKGN